MFQKKLPKNNAENENPEKIELSSEELEQVAGGIYSQPMPVPGQDMPV